MRASHLVPILALVAAACGAAKEYAMVGSPEVDSVYGTLEVEPAEGTGSAVHVVLDELPPPGRIGDDYSTYVAWAKPPSGAPVLVGALTYDAQSRRGTLEATTPLRAFTFLVTAESSARPEAPSSLVVAEHRVETGQ